MTTMLYQCPGDEMLWGLKIKTTVVEDDDVDQHLDEGWHKHPFDARDAHEAEKEKVIEAVEIEVAAEIESEVAPVRNKPGPKPKVL